MTRRIGAALFGLLMAQIVGDELAISRMVLMDKHNDSNFRAPIPQRLRRRERTRMRRPQRYD